MIKVGNRKVLFAKTILVPNGDEVRLEHDLTESDHLICILRFKPDEATSDGKPKITTEFADNIFYFDFLAFKDPAGHNVGIPFEFGISDAQETLSMICSVNKFPRLTKIDFQVMLGDTE